MAFIEKDDPQGIEIPEAFKNLDRAKRLECVEKIAFENGTISANICEVCLDVIVTAIFKGTGVCCDDHRKLRKKQVSDEQYQRVMAWQAEQIRATGTKPPSEDHKS